jgi:hypothetical protein
VPYTLKKQGSATITITFSDVIDEETATLSVSQLLSELDLAAPIDLVFDVRACSAYTSAARGVWQKAMWPRRRDLRTITVITRSPLMRMGATMFGLALGIVVTSREEP